MSIKKHRCSSSKAGYHWVLYQQIENRCSFLLAGSHKIFFFFFFFIYPSLVAERAALLCVYSSLIQPITGSRTLTQRVGERRSFLVTEHSMNPFSSTEGQEDTSAKSALVSCKFGGATIMPFVFNFGTSSHVFFSFGFN